MDALLVLALSDCFLAPEPPPEATVPPPDAPPPGVDEAEEETDPDLELSFLADFFFSLLDCLRDDQSN